MRPRNDVHGYEFSDSFGSRRSCIGGRLHGTHVSPYHYGNVSASDLFFSDQTDTGGFDHGVRRFDRADETTSLHHAEGYSVIF